MCRIKWCLLFIGLAIFFSCNENVDKKQSDKDVKNSVVKEKPSINPDIKEVQKPEKTKVLTASEKTAFLMGKFDPKKHTDFVKIDSKYADRLGLFLQKAAYDSYRLMYDAALKDGVQLVIRSATRNFDYQKGIWERKWKGNTLVDGKNLSQSISDPIARAKEILHYSSMPGTSRHHWGTDIDLNSFDNAWFEKGEGKVLYEWLMKNASKYGYCQVYTSKETTGRTGYEEEKWHWSYLPLSKSLTLAAKKLLTDQHIKGFDGAQTAPKVEMVKNYILGIDKGCL